MELIRDSEMLQLTKSCKKPPSDKHLYLTFWEEFPKFGSATAYIHSAWLGYQAQRVANRFLVFTNVFDTHFLIPGIVVVEKMLHIVF